MFYEALKSFRSIIKNKKITKISSNASKIPENMNNRSSLDLNDVNKEIHSDVSFIKAYFM
jgi:hypothetical protein